MIIFWTRMTRIRLRQGYAATSLHGYIFFAGKIKTLIFLALQFAWGRKKLCVFLKPLTGWGYSTALKNSKYLSLLNPMIRMLFLITNVGTSLYLGITTGRIAPGK